MSSKVNNNNNLKIIKKLLLAPSDFRKTDYQNKACFSQAWTKYGCMETWELALNIINNLPVNENTFNELILDGFKVKPYLDIEWLKENFPMYDSDIIKSTIKTIIVQIFDEIHQIKLDTNDIYFTQCHRKTYNGYKFSFHAIVSPHPSLVFYNANCASSLAKMVKIKLQKLGIDPSIVDGGVYKKTQNMRLPGHCKLDELIPMTMENPGTPLEYVITYIDKEYILLKSEEQDDKLYESIQNVSKINLDGNPEILDTIFEKVELIHPSYSYDCQDENDFFQFNYSDRKEFCFAGETNKHDKIGFFVYIQNNLIFAGCHSNRCVDDNNKKVIRIIGTVNTTQNLTFQKVDFDNNFKIDHLFVKTCILNGAIGISNLFHKMYLEPKRIKWINNSKNGSSYFWDGKLWQEDDYSFLERLLVTTIVRVLRDFKETFEKNNDLSDDKIKEFIKIMTAMINRLNDGILINNIMKFIKPLIRDTTFDKIKDIHPHYLSCKNGMVDLRSGVLNPSVPEDNITKCLETAYNKSADSSDFELFVRQITSNEKGQNPELYDYFRWIIGYTTQGLPVKKIFIILYGPHGFNGKSLVMNTIKEVLEGYAVSMDNSVVLDNGSKKTAGSHSTELFQLEHARFGLLSDTKEDACLDDGRIKQLTGITDKISGREIFGKQKEFSPTFVPFISTNHPIQVNLNDQAMYERLILFPFILSFIDNPIESYQKKSDNSLSEKFKNNKEGILKWIIDSCVFYNQNKNLKTPDLINKAKQQYNKQVNMYIDFIDTTFETTDNESDKVSKTALIESYKIYMEQNGMKHKCKAKIAERELDKLIKFTTSPSKQYIGIKYLELAQEYDELA